jgi:chromate reductase, NAD(P)H dehydrogenase (quinone)
VSGQARILLVPGSPRSGSASTAALITAAEIAPSQVTAVRYEGLAALPAFNPDLDGDLLPELAVQLRRQIGESDAVLFCTPEYAGALPGSLKNLLDWTVGGGEFYGKPAAWINVAAPGRGKGAEDSLAAVLGYVGADIVEAACRRIPVDREAIGPDGTVIGLKFALEVAEVWDALLSHLGKL